MASSTADKKRRQQRLAIGGIVLLAIVLVIQVPRTLKMIKGTAAQPVAASASSPASATPSVLVPLTDTEPARSTLPTGTRKDPFAARTRELGDPIVKARELGFRLVPTARTAEAVTARPRGAYVVVLRSVPVAEGRAVALRAAEAFRKVGLADAGVLVSAKYGSLHKGYYVVHAGRFPTRLAAWGALLEARRAGAPSPYVRPLKA